ncbi:GL12817 [Drosophila persimilis]|uniref:GL12817 n=1 Tax=Drosophila persimilis TaxID=7234 RepID=B4H7S9_DROPE|nr:GL12817 [Drosophila persimilis]
MQNSMLKRRISFSGKKSVRVFVNTEEPHYWENSYELSDCTNGEDNSKEQAPKTGPSRQAPTADKENVHIDMTLNLRTSIDVPMFPCETNRNRPNCSVPRESLFAESFSLSSIGREKLKDTLYSHRITDKTIDLMQITSKVGDDCSLDLSTLKKEHMKGQPTTFVSDSLMDITPLGFVDPVAASVPVPVEKDNDNPVQKSFKEVEECRKDSQRQGDISFDCDINDFSARDRMPSNGSSDTDSNNSTINYLGDESALIPFDMISGNNISKKLNFRQLNDDLEAGKIKVFANGPRTPTTDPRAKQKKFWHGLDEDIDQDQQHKDINIRSIKPRGPLNFSVNMTMSPLAQATPVARVVPLPREKLKIPDDKRKYRLSQADEVMLDNTNFLAHAKLGDETQSRNSSKIFTRRETTYESLELDVGLPNRSSSCSQNFPPSTMQEAASKHSKPRQTIHLPAKMEQDVFQVEQAATAIPPGRSSSSSARRTLNLNESMDQDIVEEKAIVTQSEVNVMHKGAKSKRRETLLMEESMEEDIISPLKELHLKASAPPKEKEKSKTRQTLHLAKPFEEDEALPRNAATTVAIRKDTIKEHLPTGNHRYKGRQTILQAEPIEEDVTPRKDYEHFPEKKDYKHLAEPVQAHHVSDSRYRSSKSRQTLLMAEAIEENHSTAYHSLEPKISQEVREKSVAFEPINTLPLSELIEESKAALRTSKARQTLPLAAPMDVEGEEPPTEPPLEESTKVAPSRGSRAQQTLIMSESMEEQEEEVDFHSPIQSIRTHPELLPITPMLRLNGSGSVCSMDEFELFEEESKQAATPRGPLQKASVLLRKIRSMGESMKMSFEEDTSGCGTPIRHSGNAKRLSDHLTPNLPEAKKRNTHLLADSKTEQEMEMDMSVSIKEVTTAVDKNCDLILRPQRPVLEQRPITISDVSAYFQAQPCKVKKKPAESKTEKEDEEKRDTCPRYSGSSTDRSFKSYEPTNKRFINLSGDTNSSTALMGTINVDEMETSHIDKVRLSLVSTLADEPDTDEEAPVEGAAALAKQPQPEPEPESCQEQQASSRVVAAGSSASCRKCMNCRRSLNETRLSNDSFVLPSQPQWDLTREIEMLRRVRARPNLDDVHKYWEMKEQERQTIALEKELDSSSDASDEEFSEWDVNEVMAGYNRKMERFKRNLADKPDILQQALVRFEPVETFFDRLAGLLTEQQPNWIFDYQLKISRKLIFTHRLLTTFRLIVDYETVDDLETAIRVCALNVEQATLIFPLQSWTAFEHLLDFQLQLKMPVSHTDSIEGSSVEAFAQFLQRTDTICVDVLRTFHKLLKVLTTTKASLLRQGNQMVIKKTVRRRIEVDTRTAIEKTDFVIEVANVEGISFRDILHPRIHFFNENIQYLPVGVAFLEEFLDHPEQYLKT